MSELLLQLTVLALAAALLAQWRYTSLAHERASLALKAVEALTETAMKQKEAICAVGQTAETLTDVVQQQDTAIRHLLKHHQGETARVLYDAEKWKS